MPYLHLECCILEKFTPISYLFQINFPCPMKRELESFYLLSIEKFEKLNLWCESEWSKIQGNFLRHFRGNVSFRRNEKGQMGSNIIVCRKYREHCLFHWWIISCVTKGCSLETRIQSSVGSITFLVKWVNHKKQNKATLYVWKIKKPLLLWLYHPLVST